VFPHGPHLKHMKPIFGIALLVLASWCLTGCEKDTNEITPQSVESANKHRIEVIDNDKNMTPEQKQKMKEMLGLIPGKGRGRK